MDRTGDAAAFHASLTSASAATALFCPHCGRILVLPSTSTIVCGGCKFQCRYTGAWLLHCWVLQCRAADTAATDLEALETTTHSRQRPPPKWLKEAMGVKEDDSDSTKKHRATVRVGQRSLRGPRPRLMWSAMVYSGGGRVPRVQEPTHELLHHADAVGG